MSRRTEIRSNQTRRSVRLKRVVATLAAFFVVAIPVFAESPLARGVESSRVDAIQTIETPLGSIRVGRSVSPERAESFEPFDLTVKFQKPQEIAVADDDLAGRYGDFNVEFLGDETRDVDEKNNVVLRRWRLYPTRRGELTLPPIPISLSFVDPNDPAETQTVVALLPEQKLVVPKSDAPLKSADEVAVNLNPIRQIPKFAILTACLAFAIIALANGLFISRKRTVAPPKPSPAETPYERARRKLDELKSSRIYLENDRLFYDEIDDILREYVASVSPLKAQEMTTQEILGNLDAQSPPQANLDGGDAAPNLEEIPKEPSDAEKASIAIATLKEPAARSQLEAALTALDLVKFAKRPTTFTDASEIYSEVCDVVECSFSSYVKRLDELRRQFADRATSFNDEQKTSPKA